MFWREQGREGERHPSSSLPSPGLALREDPDTDHRGPRAAGEHGAQSRGSLFSFEAGWPNLYTAYMGL